MNQRLKLKHFAPLALIILTPLAHATANERCDIAVNDKAEVALVAADAPATDEIVVAEHVRCHPGASLSNDAVRAKVRSALIERWQGLDIEDPTARLIQRALLEMNRTEASAIVINNHDA